MLGLHQMSSRWFQSLGWLELFWAKRTRTPRHRLCRWQTWGKAGTCPVEHLGTALESPGRADASPCVPWHCCINAESSFRGLSICFVKLLVISAVHHTALQCLIPFRFVITDGESYMMEEFKIGHEVHSIYCLQSGLINFEVRKQKLKGSCQWPQNMEGWMLFNSGPEF